MKKILINFSLLFFTVFCITSCFTDGEGNSDAVLKDSTLTGADIVYNGESYESVILNNESDQGSTEEEGDNEGQDQGEGINENPIGIKVKPDQVKTIIEELMVCVNVNDIFKKYILGANLDAFPISIKDGLEIDVDISDDPFQVVLTFTFNGYKITDIGSTIDGTLVGRIERGIPDNVIMMSFNTMDGDPLIITAGKFEGTVIDINNLEVIYDISTLKFTYSGIIIINGSEYKLDDFLSSSKTLNVISGAMNRVAWDEVEDKLMDSLRNPYSFYQPLTIFNKDGLKIALSFQWSLVHPGVILTFTFNEFELLDGITTKKVNGVMRMQVSIANIFRLKLQLLLNTEENSPLMITGGYFDQTIGLNDVMMYFSLIQSQIVDETEVSGTIIINGMVVPFDSSWISLLMSLINPF